MNHMDCIEFALAVSMGIPIDEHPGREALAISALR